MRGRFQLADFDAKRGRVLFYPEGEFPFPIIERHPTALGVVLTYDAKGRFTDPASWRAYDLKKLVSPKAGGFCGGFLAGDHAYLVPLYDIAPGSNLLTGPHMVPNGLAVKIDLLKPLSDPAAYQSFDIAQLGFSPIGYCGGVEALGHAYFAPAGTGSAADEFSGVLLRTDEFADFTKVSSWQWFDLKQIDAKAAGFQAIAAVTPYVYLIPYFRPVMVRYDTRRPLSDRSAYQLFDLNRVTREPLGLCGVIVAGTHLVLTPLVDYDHLRTISTALWFDTTRPLNDPGAWKAMDLSKVDKRAGGYQSGWADKNGFVWLAPDTSMFHGTPPLIVWNSRLPFDDAKSWKTYPTVGRTPAATGAAYDPLTNRAWLSPYGDGNNNAITQIEMH